MGAVITRSIVFILLLVFVIYVLKVTSPLVLFFWGNATAVLEEFIVTISGVDNEE